MSFRLFTRMYTLASTLRQGHTCNVVDVWSRVECVCTLLWNSDEVSSRGGDMRANLATGCAASASVGVQSPFWDQRWQRGGDGGFVLQETTSRCFDGCV